jgi:hypothetical protein
MSPARLALVGSGLGVLAVVGVVVFAPGLQFGSMAFLAGLAAAVIPILIHLIHRRRARVRAFAAVDFLLVSNKRVAQRLKVRQILLLIVRTLLIACVPLALSKPALEAEAGELESGPGPSANVIVLDNTLSMAYRHGGRTLFERAKDRAQELVLDLPREATAAFLLAATPLEGSGPSRVEHPELTFDHHEVAGALARVSLSPRTADLESVVRRADQIVALSPLPRKRILVLTDFARHGWGARSLSATPLVLTSKAQLVVHDVSRGASRGNRAIVTVEVVPAADLGPGGHRITARIANFSERAAKEVPVLLRAGGRVVARGAVDIPAGAASEKVFHHRFALGGIVDGEVAIEPDAFAEDDVRRFALDVRRPAEALVVDGDPRQIPHLDEVFYLERALRLSGSPVRVRVTTADERPEVRFEGHDAVFLCNVRSLTRARERELQSFVEKGGGLFVSMGPLVDLDAYNTGLGSLLPRRLRARRDVTYGGGAPVRLARPDLAHPVLSVFSGAALDGLLSATVREYVHVETRGSNEVGSLLHYDDGAPALLHARRGRGHVLLLTTTVDRDWTDLPIRTGFLPLVQQAARFLSQTLESPGSHDVIAGEVRLIPLGGGADEVLVEGPNDLRVRFAGDEVRGRSHVPFRGTEALGIYRVSAVREGRSQFIGAFAVNPPPVESDLAQLSPAQAASLMPKTRADVAQGAALATLGHTALWPWVALALLAFLLVESFMVRRS